MQLENTPEVQTYAALDLQQYLQGVPYLGELESSVRSLLDRIRQP